MATLKEILVSSRQHFKNIETASFDALK